MHQTPPDTLPGVYESAPLRTVIPVRGGELRLQPNGGTLRLTEVRPVGLLVQHHEAELRYPQFRALHDAMQDPGKVTSWGHGYHLTQVRDLRVLSLNGCEPHASPITLTDDPGNTTWDALKRMLVHVCRRYEIHQNVDSWKPVPENAPLGLRLVGWVEADNLEDAFVRSQHGVSVNSELDPDDPDQAEAAKKPGARLIPTAWYRRPGSGRADGVGVMQVTSSWPGNVITDPAGKHWQVAPSGFTELTE